MSLVYIPDPFPVAFWSGVLRVVTLAWHCDAANDESHAQDLKLQIDRLVQTSDYQRGSTAILSYKLSFGSGLHIYNTSIEEDCTGRRLDLLAWPRWRESGRRRFAPRGGRCRVGKQKPPLTWGSLGRRFVADKLDFTLCFIHPIHSFIQIRCVSFF